MVAILFLQMYDKDFHFVAARTSVLRVDSFMLKINLAASIWMSPRVWSDFEDPHSAIEYVILGMIPLNVLKYS